MFSPNRFTSILWTVFASIIWLAAMYGMSKVPQNDFLSLVAFSIPGYGLYFFTIVKKKGPWQWWVFAALLCRLLFAFQFPLLSDDIFRFFFDGMLTIHGESPYGVIPATLADISSLSMDPSILSKMNSPDYYTVYPPVSQLVFAAGALTKDIVSANIIMALIMLLAEGIAMCFLIRLLQKRQIPLSNILWYYLNPLVILEGFGNLHFE